MDFTLDYMLSQEKFGQRSRRTGSDWLLCFIKLPSLTIRWTFTTTGLVWGIFTTTGLVWWIFYRHWVGLLDFYHHWVNLVDFTLDYMLSPENLGSAPTGPEATGCFAICNYHLLQLDGFYHHWVGLVDFHQHWVGF